MVTGGSRTGRRLAQWGIVLAGAVGLQVALYGPALAGRTVLLPLNLLAQGATYAPERTPVPFAERQSPVFGDLVFLAEHVRSFTTREAAAGRLAVWDPNSFAGAPFAMVGRFSPVFLIGYLLNDPTAIAWEALARALIGTAGAFAFFRRDLGARFWPAAVGAWCFPLTGFVVLWQGYGPGAVVVWLPALLAGVGMTVRRPAGWGPVVVAGCTFGAASVGQLDLVGLVLLVSGFYALFRLAARYGVRPTRRLGMGVAGVSAGWAAGLLLAAPTVLPILKYAGEGQRLNRRAGGSEERPPGDPSAAVLLVAADWFGSHPAGRAYFGKGNQLESAAGGYAGLAAALAAAPLAGLSRRHRRINLFWAAAGLLGACWVCGAPGVVALMRAPGLNLFSFNRLTFVTAFAVLVLAVTGLNAVWGRANWGRPWLWVPAGVLGLLLLAAVGHSTSLPREYAVILRNAPKDVAGSVAEGLVAGYQFTAAVAALGLGAVVVAANGHAGGRWWPAAVGGLMVVELVLWADGKTPQSPPSEYYPKLPVLERIREANDGRVLPFNCLPAAVPATVGLRDVRGYDAVDPRPVVDVLDQVRAKADQSPPYARTQFYVPKLSGHADTGLVLPPALDLLGVKYVVVPGQPLPVPGLTPAWSGDGYHVYVNAKALPRAFVPAEVRTLPDEAAVLKAVGDPAFAPRAVAYVTADPSVSPGAAGTVTVDEPEPARVVLTADLSATGLVVLADQWADGWTATVDGAPAPIARVDYAVKGVVAPAGRHVIEFRYALPGLATGFAAAGLAPVVLAGWYFAARAFRRPGRELE